MKKNILISIFIFLTSLFAGIFFCAGINPQTRINLSNLMLSGMQSDSHNFFVWFFLIFISHLKMYLIMIPALFIKFLIILPTSVLIYRSFSTGFCCGLVYISSVKSPFLFSLMHLLPQNFFIIPAYIIFASAVITFSLQQKNRSLSLNDRNLLISLILSIAVTFAGSLIETIIL